MLAAVHLLVLGFVVMVMLGALFQLLPVLTGEPIPRAKATATVVHSTLVLGVMSLASAFTFNVPWLFAAAALLLGSSFLVFILALASKLVRRIGGGDSLFTMRLAALSLLVTMGLGLYSSLGFFLPQSGVPIHGPLTNVHAGFGLVGWIGLLVMAVSFQVVPMFHVAPSFPPRLARGLSLLVFLSLAGLAFLPSRWPQKALVLVMGGGLLVYAGTVLLLLARRKRLVPDPTVRFWQLGLVSLVLAVISLWAVVFLPLGQLGSVLILGAFAILGFACSVIMGMLPKIVSFLIFLHLQRSCLRHPEAMAQLPSMHAIVPIWRSKLQLSLHVLALAWVLVAVFWPGLGPVAAAFLAIDFAWLACCLLLAVGRYSTSKVAIARMPSARA